MCLCVSLLNSGAFISGSEWFLEVFVYFESLLKVTCVVSNIPWVLFVDGFFPLVIPGANN